MKHYLKCLRSYASFRGRARREEYWMFFLFNMIFAFVAMGIDNILGTTITMKMPAAPGSMTLQSIHLPYGYIYIAYALFTLIPSWAAAWRRMHDIGKSGWLLIIIPVIAGVIGGILEVVLILSGSIILGVSALIFVMVIASVWCIYMLATDSTPGDNKYGPNPKGIQAQPA
jgi:uncharacterized membrane protein YhaH (DUF805 family)